MKRILIETKTVGRVTIEVTDAGELVGLVFNRPVRTLSADQFTDVQGHIARAVESVRETADLAAETSPAIPGAPGLPALPTEKKVKGLQGLVEGMFHKLKADGKFTPGEEKNVRGILDGVSKLLGSSPKK